MTYRALQYDFALFETYYSNRTKVTGEQITSLAEDDYPRIAEKFLDITYELFQKIIETNFAEPVKKTIDKLYKENIEDISKSSWIEVNHRPALLLWKKGKSTYFCKADLDHCIESTEFLFELLMDIRRISKFCVPLLKKGNVTYKSCEVITEAIPDEFDEVIEKITEHCSDVMQTYYSDSKNNMSELQYTYTQTNKTKFISIAEYELIQKRISEILGSFYAYKLAGLLYI